MKIMNEEVWKPVPRIRRVLCSIKLWQNKIISQNNYQAV